ncbi:proton-coupled folate transporter-like [Plodia interpunctella]|uniref:proton-coupled folate transporter-like n=1 Tax=Plodia interpunctella TaxID=58824 RepID=UPI0023674F9F|nr:proton-coupled folate transporter-like [Plodia interpunctella]XP_053602303.1 proton-coupled folate transporter-like [Plodia interpunctella]XP_053602304.1 proton-coupled folate transporter-like [Plodia interpunctella]XP_053602305.1 proton-coupled folate transporter-like [Plodia interpunctella]
MADEKCKEIDSDENPLNKNVTEIVKKTKTFKEKLKFIRENITVEPLLAGLIIPSVISRFAMVNLNLDKACRVNLNFSSEICDTIIQKTTNSNYSEYEKEVQKLISSIDIWKSVIHTAIPCVIIMFLGAWSDRTGKRKTVIMLPIFGEIVTSISNLINVYFFYEIPVEITVFLETIFPAITGGWVTMFLGVFSYISDITDEESRTFRVGLVNFCMTAGLPIGIGVGGILVQRMGYYGIFSMTSVLFVLIATYGLTCLHEPDEFLRRKGLPPIERPDCSGVSFFQANHVIETVEVAYKRRPSRRRLKIILTLFTVFIVYGPSMSEHTIFYLFVRNTLSWDMVKYSLYTSYSIILHSFGAMFGITVLSKRLQIDDSMLCLISVVSKFAGSVWTAFVKTDLEMYLVPVVEILNGTIFTSLRSIVTKQVDKQETAKMNSLFSLTETLAALMFHPFYSWLYMRTLHVLPGAVFLTSAALLIPAFIILVSFYTQYRMDLRSARKKALEAEEKKETEVSKISALSFYNPDIKPNVGLKTDDNSLPKIDLLDNIKKDT